jgi:ATP-dependent RNA helicase DHX37/DHR1
MLALSHQHGLTEHTVTMVAALSMQEVLLETPVGDHQDTFDKGQIAQIRAKWAGSGHTQLLGDPMVLLSAVYDTEYAGCTRDFCDKSGLRFKAMQEIRKLRKQLANEMTSLKVVLNPKTRAPGKTEAFLLRQILLSGLPDQVAHRLPIEEHVGPDKKKLKLAYHTRTLEQPVFLHHTSVLKRNPPDWLIYQEIFEIEGKMYMRGVTAIDPSWLPEFCTMDCNLSKPLADREAIYEEGQVLTFRTGTFGERGWPLPLIKTEHPTRIERLKYFAKFILEGEVLPELKQFTGELMSPPVAMIRTWGSLHIRRVKPLFEALSGQNIDSKEKLLTALQENSQFLKSAYLNWLDQDFHAEVNQIWAKLSK